jgi:hypothetical protein
VKDTKADNKCAYVKAFGGGQAMTPEARACGKGKKTDFHWTTKGTHIDAMLYVA